jgi:surfeit locus 1 family protein
MQKRELIRLTVVTLIGLAVLISLGVWQLQRLEWKESLIARIEARTARAPLTLERATEIAGERRNASYFPVRVTGSFHHARERYLYAFSLDGQPGWHVITPLETVDGNVVLIDRGFVPNTLRDPSTRALGQIEDVETVIGFMRSSEEASIFIPDNDSKTNQWFSRDLSAMASSMVPGGTVQVSPFYLEAKASEVPGGWPQGGQTRLELANEHLQYALIWFGLALCLVVIYGVYIWGAYRRPRS